MTARLRSSTTLVADLAASIGHDLNNILTGILATTDLLRRRADSTGLDWEIDTIADGARRARALCRELVSMGQPVLRGRVSCSLREAVNEASRLVIVMVGEDVALEIQHRGEDFCVLADPTEIERIVVNLVLNARDASARGGAVTVVTDTVVVGPEDVGDHPLAGRTGSFARLSVSDTGTGMSAAVRARAFEPYFTTKEEGTGLGLHSCLRIATTLGGGMDAESAPSVGTTIRVYLPRAATETGSATAT